MLKTCTNVWLAMVMATLLAGCSTSIQIGGDSKDAKGEDGGVGASAQGADASSLPDGAIALDGENTTINFVGSKPSGDKHDGGFKELSGYVLLDGDNPQSIVLTVQTESIWSDNQKLTGHLKTGDFFLVARHKSISFKSTKIEAAADGDATHKITGELTMLDDTHMIEVPAKAEVDGGRISINSDFSIDRTQWGMNYGEGKVNNEVKIALTIQAKQ